MTLPASAAIGAVLFDMDGLLLDSERLALAILTRSARDLGIDWDENVGLAMVGRNRRDSDALLDRRYPGDPRIPLLQDEFRRRYDEHIAQHGVATKPGAVALIDLLERHAVPRAVATSTQHQRAARKLARVGLLERFDALIGGDQVARGKPAPDIFLAAAFALRVAPADCVVLEDSNAGVRAALAAGMNVVMVPDVLPPEPDLAGQGLAVAPSLISVAEMLSPRLSKTGVAG